MSFSDNLDGQLRRHVCNLRRHCSSIIFKFHTWDVSDATGILIVQHFHTCRSIAVRLTRFIMLNNFYKNKLIDNDSR